MKIDKIQKNLMKEFKDIIKNFKKGYALEDEKIIIIYKDGYSIHSDEMEEEDFKNIKTSNIVYGAYMSGYVCSDTLAGNFNNCDDYWNHIEQIFINK